MFGRSRKAARPTSHIHEFSNHNVGADLQRQVCRVCGHITINPIPPTDLRSEILEAFQDRGRDVALVHDVINEAAKNKKAVEADTPKRPL